MCIRDRARGERDGLSVRRPSRGTRRPGFVQQQAWRGTPIARDGPDGRDAPVLCLVDPRRHVRHLAAIWGPPWIGDEDEVEVILGCNAAAWRRGLSLEVDCQAASEGKSESHGDEGCGRGKA